MRTRAAEKDQTETNEWSLLASEPVIVIGQTIAFALRY